MLETIVGTLIACIIIFAVIWIADSWAWHRKTADRPLSQEEILAMAKIGGLQGVTTQIRDQDGTVIADAVCITKLNFSLPEGYAAFSITGASSKLPRS